MVAYLFKLLYILSAMNNKTTKSNFEIEANKLIYPPVRKSTSRHLGRRTPEEQAALEARQRIHVPRHLDRKSVV